MPLWLQAGGWGLLAGSTLVAGAALGWFVRIPRLVVASVLAAIAISNLPEGLSSSAGMKRSGRSARYVFGVWSAIALASGLAGMLGCLLLDGAAPESIAVITAVAAGAILTMVADTMIPEAFERTHLYAGLIAAVGFLAAFALERV